MGHLWDIWDIWDIAPRGNGHRTCRGTYGAQVEPSTEPETGHKPDKLDIEQYCEGGCRRLGPPAEALITFSIEKGSLTAHKGLIGIIERKARNGSYRRMGSSGWLPQ